nr:protein Simiate isoform X1 [Ipomoea batatas]
MPKPADWLKIKASLLGKEDYCYICNDNKMKEYVSKLEKELASTRAQLQAQNDMQKAMGGALVAVLEKIFGKVPEQFVTLLTKHLNQILLTAEHSLLMLVIDSDYIVFDEGSLAVAVAGFNPHLMLMLMVLMEFVIVGV